MLRGFLPCIVFLCVSVPQGAFLSGGPVSTSNRNDLCRLHPVTFQNRSCVAGREKGSRKLTESEVGAIQIEGDVSLSCCPSRMSNSHMTRRFVFGNEISSSDCIFWRNRMSSGCCNSIISSRANLIWSGGICSKRSCFVPSTAAALSLNFNSFPVSASTSWRVIQSSIFPYTMETSRGNPVTSGKPTTCQAWRKWLIDFNDPISKRRGYRKILKDKPIHRIYNHSVRYLRRLSMADLRQRIIDVRHERFMNKIRKNAKHEDYSSIYEKELYTLLKRLYVVAHEKDRGLNRPKATDEEAKAEDERIELVKASEHDGRAREWNGGIANPFGASGFLGMGHQGGLGPGPTGYMINEEELRNEAMTRDKNDWFYGRGNGKRSYD